MPLKIIRNVQIRHIYIRVLICHIGRRTSWIRVSEHPWVLQGDELVGLALESVGLIVGYLEFKAAVDGDEVFFADFGEDVKSEE